MLMFHTKLLLRRLAYVPWLLTVGLVLGWSGEAVAHTTGDGTNVAGHAQGAHTHATEPYLQVSYALDKRTGDGLTPAAGTADTVFVSWSTSYSKNFGTAKSTTVPGGNGAEADDYTLTLHRGEGPVSNIQSDTGGGALLVTPDATIPAGGVTDLTSERKATLILNLDPRGTTPAGTNPPGFYWVKIAVDVPNADNDPDTDANNIPEFFAKQIAIEPDYILSVNPNSVREDVTRATEIEVNVKVGDDTAVTQDEPVNLRYGTNQTGHNSRFRIEFFPITIPEGEKEATGTIRFTPIRNINHASIPDNDLLVTVRSPGSTGGSTDIRLVDVDKASTAINLSFSDATLAQTDDTTEIEVTATLNGKTLEEHMSLPVLIDNTMAPGKARRDIDYITGALGSITIRRRQESGKTTIAITPLNEGPGYILFAPGTATSTARNPTVDPVPVNSSRIEITGGPERAIKGLTAMPSSVREDAGSKEITLEISLQNALTTDETVQFTFSDRDEDVIALAAEDDRFADADDADRGIDYEVSARPIVIPRGETVATTTMTVTPINNTREDGLRAFRVFAHVAGKTLDEGILINDDDSTSDSITLEVSPSEISESDGPTEVTVTGTLNGKVFKSDVVVPLTFSNDLDGDGATDGPKDVAADVAATRDIDYASIPGALVIPGGAVSGRVTFTITPINPNDGKEGDEKIGVASASKPKGIDEDDVEEVLDVVGATITLKDAGTQPTTPTDPTTPTVGEVADQEYTVGTAIAPLVLPEASGGTAPLTYSLSALPAGLSFNAATRTLSGTPTAATDGAVIVYTVVDNDRKVTVLAVFNITVNEGDGTVTPPPVDAAVQLSVTPAEIREDAGTTSVSLTVTLPAARVVDETVTFTIGHPSEGTPAVRDVDYIASLGAVVTIPVGTTTGRATLTLTPINNTEEDGPRAIGVQATFASGATLMKDIKIVDDETPSTSITLSVDPASIVEGSGQTNVTVTATLNGDTLTENATVIVAIGEASTATRDVDYSAIFNPLITILAGAREGSTQFSILAIDDGLAEGNETIKLIGVINELTGSEAEITLVDEAAPPEPMEPDDSALAFADGTVIPNQTYTAGTPITPLVLPEASGGTAPLRYSLSALPAGLAFDAATRTITGTPAAATDAVIVIYTVIDSAGEVDALTFTIAVNEGISFDDFFNLFPSGKIVPTASHDLVEIRAFVVGQRGDALVLPVASGGTAPLTYSLSPALPAGLAFDAATRTIAGTPQAAAETAYTYTVTDANGASASLALQTLPATFVLADNFPNPFNPATTIKYALPQAADVELTVYNVVGQVVRTLVAEHQSAGRYVVEWDATNDNGHSLSSGIYFYRLQAGSEFREIKKMLLLK